MKILQFPLTKITIGFILGIILFRFITLYSSFVFLGLTIGIVFLFFLHLKSQNSKIIKQLFGIITLLLSVLIGISTAIINKETSIQNHYINQKHDFESQHNLKIILVEKIKNSSKETLIEENVPAKAEKKKFSGWDLAALTAKALNKATGKDIKLNKEYDNKGNVVEYGLVADNFEFSRSR